MRIYTCLHRCVSPDVSRRRRDGRSAEGALRRFWLLVCRYARSLFLAEAACAGRAEALGHRGLQVTPNCSQNETFTPRLRRALRRPWADALGAVALGLDGRPVFIRKREHDLDLRSSACVPSPWTMKRPFVSSPIDLRETKLIYVKQNGFHSLEVYNSR